MIVLISIASLLFLGWLIFTIALLRDGDYFEGFMGSLFILICVVCVDLAILSPIIVLDKSSGMTIGEITSVDRNFWGSTAIYLKTTDYTQEKYCAENEDIIEFAKNHIGQKVKIGYGERVGFYELKQCDQSPIIHIEVWEE